MKATGKDRVKAAFCRLKSGEIFKSRGFYVFLACALILPILVSAIADATKEEN